MNFDFLPEEILPLIEKLPKNLAEASSRELEATKQYDVFTRKIRVAFWKEYELSASRMRRMTLSHVAHRMGTNHKLIHGALRNHMDLAFILCPPESYDNFLDEALDFGLKRLRDDVLTLPIYMKDELGRQKINTKVADLILKTVAFLDVRKHGMPKQSITQLNVTQKLPDFNQQNRSLKTLEEVTARIEQLKASGMTNEMARTILEQGGRLPKAEDIETATPTEHELKREEESLKLISHAELVEELLPKKELRTSSFLSSVKKITDINLKNDLKND